MVLVVAVDYNVPLAYSLYFLAQSFRSELPWSGCYDWWGADKELCFVRQKGNVSHDAISDELEAKVMMLLTLQMRKISNLKYLD